MRILFVIDCLGSGGAQRQLVELALGFKNLGHDVAFLTYHPETFYYTDLKNAGISITCIISSNYIMRLINMRSFIRMGKFNSVISFLEAANFICEVAGFPRRNWSLIAGERSSNPAIKKSLKLKIYRWFHLFADYVVANSQTNMQIVKSVNHFLKESKCRVIYNIVDFRCWHPSIDYIPRRDGKLKMVVAASHFKLKNLNGLVEAISLLGKNEKSMLLVEWYGDRLNEPFFDNSIIEAKRKIDTYQLTEVISFYPATKDLNLKIQQADIVGIFSYYEGLPNVVCEGMACAKPVICSAVSDIPSLLSYDQNLLFCPTSVESIRCTLSYIIGLTNEQLISIGQINKKIARDRFKKDTIIDQYLDLIILGLSGKYFE